jgi:hypothetical protein
MVGLLDKTFRNAAPSVLGAKSYRLMTTVAAPSKRLTPEC